MDTGITPRITWNLVETFLFERGWINECPGAHFAWKDPVSGISGYCRIAALENQLDYDLLDAGGEPHSNPRRTHTGRMLRLKAHSANGKSLTGDQR